MSDFDQRRKAYEDKYMHDEELRFRATVKALRSLLDWSVTKGLAKAETQDYKDHLIEDMLMNQGVAMVLTQVRDDMADLPEAPDFVTIESQFNTLLERHVQKLVDGGYAL